MDLVAIAGKVSHINRTLSTIAGDGSGLGTTYSTALRIDGRHVEIDDTCQWVSNDDYVAIVGEMRGHELVPLAIRNDTTGFERIGEVPSSYGRAFLLIVLGIVLFALIIGIFMIAWGLWSIFRVKRDKKVLAEAKRRLDAIPRAVTPAAA